MNQTKIDSFIEQIFNVGSGFIIAALTWAYIVRPLIQTEYLSLDSTIYITIIFTVISVIRGYIWRRIFNDKQPWTRIKEYL